MPARHIGGLLGLLKTIQNNVQGVLVFGVCTISTIFWVIPLTTLAVLKLLIPLTGFRRTTTRWIMQIGENWVAFNAAVFGRVNTTQWDVRGLEGLERERWYLLIANHQTWIDIVALQTVFNRRIPFLKFFLKQELIWFPFLGIAWWGMDMPFMKRYSRSYLAKHPQKKGKDLEATRKACEKFRYTPTSVINFIEGTRFSEEKRQARASPYEYLLPPRAGGLALALDTMGKLFDEILDITIVYPGGPPKFWAMCYGEFDRVVIDIKRRPVEAWMLQGDYINDRDYRSRFHKWLTEVWHEKDQQIGAIHRACDGPVTETPNSSRQIA